MECEPWGMAALSSGVAATLEVIDVSCCFGLISLDALRSCSKLRCLRMPGVSVADLSPLAACNRSQRATLEELWLADNHEVESLVPLKACIKLLKLDVRDSPEDLRSQVADLQTACTQLAAPSSVELKGLVHELRPDMPPRVQAAGALGHMATYAPRKTTIPAAGAIPPLVQLLLAPDSSDEVLAAAAGALRNLAANHAQNKIVIARAGAIPPQVHLLGPDFSEDMQQVAAGALGSLAHGNANNKSAIAAAGAIPLVILVGFDPPYES
ncbi:hypothetical protein FOA52_010095 [Chlamydomonas sp. UWO 241]|nr:hypothetical protein FOA52_010095 [Chlamydomonas sp. UWO 241]